MEYHIRVEVEVLCSTDAANRMLVPVDGCASILQRLTDPSTWTQMRGMLARYGRIPEKRSTFAKLVERNRLTEG